MEKSTINKMQHQFWVSKQKVYRKLGKKEDECIVASDSMLDAKLELFKSIQTTSNSMNKLLDKYQERICYLAHVQNEMGRFLKEHGKIDKSAAGKMMIQMGKSLIYSSQQEIALRPPLLRLYQEVETFRNRAVEDTMDTINAMEKNRTEYRASLNWMKNVSQELEPDSYKQMEKFKKVQNHVKKNKEGFDRLKLACLQKVDLLAAARCNMFSHALILYQSSMSKITGKNERVFKTLANTFKGHCHYEFSFISELKEPSRRLAKEVGQNAPTEELLFDFGEEGKKGDEGEGQGEKDVKEKDAKIDSKPEPIDLLGGEPSPGTTTDSLLQLGDDGGPQNGLLQQTPSLIDIEKRREEDLLCSANASALLENLLGPLDLSPDPPDPELALEALLSLSSLNGQPSNKGEKPNTTPFNSFSFSSSTSLNKEKGGGDKENPMTDLLTDDFEGIPFEMNDTMALLNEIMNVGGLSAPVVPSKETPLPNIPTSKHQSEDKKMPNPIAVGKSNVNPCSFFPSQLLDLDNLDMGNTGGDLLGFTAIQSTTSNPHASTGSSSSNPKGGGQASGLNKSWYDVFADLDPIANPDSVPGGGGGGAKKEEEVSENRYC